MEGETHPTSCADCWKKELCLKNIDDLTETLLDCWEDEGVEDTPTTRSIAAALEETRKFQKAPTPKQHEVAMIAAAEVSKRLAAALEEISGY